MKKERLICFRVSRDLHESLSLAANRERRSLSSIIEITLTNYLKERKALKDIGTEKRIYPRQALAVPVVIHQQDPREIGIGTIREISLGGVGIIIPEDSKHKIQINTQGSRFEIMFTFPQENKLIKLLCESRRAVDSQEGPHIGASFVDADFQSYKFLQTHLM